MPPPVVAVDEPPVEVLALRPVLLVPPVGLAFVPPIDVFAESPVRVPLAPQVTALLLPATGRVRRAARGWSRYFKGHYLSKSRLDYPPKSTVAHSLQPRRQIG